MSNNNDWIKEVKKGDKLTCKSVPGKNHGETKAGGAGYEPNKTFTVGGISSHSSDYNIFFS